MKDIIINVSRETRKIECLKSFIGNDGENLQGNIIFKFKDEFVDGVARLEYAINDEKTYQILTKQDNTYIIPIKSVLTKYGQINAQIVITENEQPEGIPVFKSEVFTIYCENSINAEIEQPEKYPQWIEIANAKILEIDETIRKVENLKDLGLVAYDDSEIRQEINNIDVEVENLTNNINKIATDIDTNTNDINELENKINAIDEELKKEEDEIKEMQMKNSYSVKSHLFAHADFPKTGHETRGKDFNGDVYEKTVFVFRSDIEELIDTDMVNYIHLDIKHDADGEVEREIDSSEFTLLEVTATAHDITPNTGGFTRPMRGFWHILGYHMHNESFDYYNVGITQDGVILEVSESGWTDAWWDVMIINLKYCEGNPFQVK